MGKMVFDFDKGKYNFLEFLFILAIKQIKKQLLFQAQP